MGKKDCTKDKMAAAKAAADKKKAAKIQIATKLKTDAQKTEEKAQKAAASKSKEGSTKRKLKKNTGKLEAQQASAVAKQAKIIDLKKLLKGMKKKEGKKVSMAATVKKVMRAQTTKRRAIKA